MSNFPIVGRWRRCACLCIDGRIRQSEGASKQRSGYMGHYGVVWFDDSKTRGSGRVPSRNTPLCDGHHPEIRQFVTPITRRKAMAAQ
jgi:hypothetical protein